MSYLAIFTQEDDGRFSVAIPSLPGCFSEGDTLQEAKENIQEAIELYLEEEEHLPVNIQMIMSIEMPKKNYA